MHIAVLASKDYRLILREELAQRQARNPHYSLRAMARDLDLSPSHLSEVLMGKSSLSRAVAKRLMGDFDWTVEEKDFFVASVIFATTKKTDERAAMDTRMDAFLVGRSEFHHLSLDHFRSIAEWYHLAILAALDVPSWEGSLPRIAKALNLPTPHLRAAVERLARLGLLTMDGDRLTSVHKRTKTAFEAPVSAARNFHRQILQRIAILLDHVPPSDRFISNSLLTVRKDRFPEARDMLQSFRDAFAERFADHASADQVSVLSLAFLPLSHDEDEI